MLARSDAAHAAGRLVEAEQHATAASTEALGGTDPIEVARAASTRAAIRTDLAHWNEARADVDLALHHHHVAPSPLASFALALRALADAGLGEWDTARADLRTLWSRLDMAPAATDRASVAARLIALRVRSCLHLVDGNLEAARLDADEAVGRAPRDTEVVVLRARIAAGQGDVATAEADLDALRTASEQPGVVLMTLLTQADLRATRGDVDGAAAALREIDDLLDAAGLGRAEVALVRMVKAHLALVRGDLRAALVVAEYLMAGSFSSDVTGWDRRGRCHQVRAEHRFAAGDLDGATADVHEALALTPVTGDHIRAAELMTLAARIDLARGETHLAAVALDEAVARRSGWWAPLSELADAEVRAAIDAAEAGPGGPG